MGMEPVLARKLERVAAPRELWGRIDRGQNPTQARMPVPHLAFVAAVLVVVLVWGFRPRRDFVFRSESAAQIREWVKTNAGLDVPLPGGSPLVRLTGARLLRGDVEIACRVGNREARLIVSKGKSGLQHGAQRTGNGSAVSWGMRGRLYTLACATPEDLRIACLLCHSTALN